MKIIRNGQEFELTFSEMMQAYEEYRLDCTIEDVKGVMESEAYDVELTDEQMKEVSQQAMHNLGKNDGYSDAYWSSVEYTLSEYIDNLRIAAQFDITED